MSLREDLIPIVEEALRTAGGKATIIEVAKYIWQKHRPLLERSGDDFYKWQYEMRWAAQQLVDRGVITKTDPKDPRGTWRIVK